MIIEINLKIKMLIANYSIRKHVRISVIIS